MAGFFDKLFCMLFGWLYPIDEPCYISGYNAKENVIKSFESGKFVKGGKSRKNRRIKQTKKTRRTHM